MCKSLISAILLLILFGCSNVTHLDNKIDYSNNLLIPSIEFTVIETYSHDPASFTEGLVFHDNQLFESTGSPVEFPYTRSVLGPIDLNTGKIIVKVELDKEKYFGEGITFLNNKIYQLTWKNQLGFIYDSKTYKQIGSFKFSNKEGWGLTTDGVNIIISDGTNIITYLDPDSLKMIKTLNVTFKGSPMWHLNELEYIKGYLYANIYWTSKIVEIDPKTGIITGIIDLNTLFEDARKKFPLSDVTNGIAFDSLTDKIYVTGKFWPIIYQIKLKSKK
jgi:glutaminyl-peptide cyclotransferase